MMTQTVHGTGFVRAVFAGGLAFFVTTAAFLSGQAVEEPVAIRRGPVEKPAIPRPSPKGGDAGTKEKPSGKGKADAEGVAADSAEVQEGSIPIGIEKMFPVGRTFFGVRIPSYTGDQLDSVVTTEVMKRVDEEHVDMETLVIQVYSEGQPDTKIMMDKAIYDMEEDKLTSRQTPPEILHSQFKMVGDKMTFDREARVGHMIGNVKMTIFNVESFLSEDEILGVGGK